MATDAEREKIQEILSRDEYRMNIHSNYWLRFLNHSNRTVTLSTFAFVVGTRMLGSAYFGAGALLCVGLAKVLKLVLRESRPVGTTYKVTYGMPSTHSATISYYATFITLSCAYLPIHPLFFHTWFDGPINSTIVRWFVWPTAPLVATAVASTVCASRINLGHHTIKQVMGGVCVGVSFGALWFSWWKMGGAQTIAWWATLIFYIILISCFIRTRVVISYQWLHVVCRTLDPMADNEKAKATKATTSSNVQPPASSTGTKPAPRVIGNFTNLGESSRGGGPAATSTTRMKFTPNMPVRKNKPEDATASAAQVVPAPKPTTAATRGETGREKPTRGRGRGRGRGGTGGGGDTGSGRGIAPAMVPAGPFAMGPLAAGMSGTRNAPSSASYHTGAGPSTSGKAGGSGAKAEAKPSVLPTNRDQLVIDDAPEVYSEDENEEGRVIDLEEVKMLDFMAPDALKKERRKERKSKGKQVAKKEVIEIDISEPKESGDQDPIVKEEMKNESQALDLSESEEEIELEDLQQYFQVSEDDASLNPNELYFFQFPDSFPVFSHPSELAASIDEENEVERTDESTALKAESSGKKVSFAEDVKAGSSGPATPRQREPPRTEGIIGQLEIHQSGAVRIRMPNNIVFDVSAATRPAFLQQAVLVDIDAMKMSVLGSVTRRFVASPDIDALTASLGEEKPEVMDVDLP